MMAQGGKEQGGQKDLEAAFDRLVNFMKGSDDEENVVDKMTNQIKMYPQFLTMVDKTGATLLHIGLLNDCRYDRIHMLLGFNKNMARQRYRTRLPLHLALESNPKEDVLYALLKAYEGAVKVPDTDTRLPLHIILEHQPFPANFVQLAMHVISLYPEAAVVKSHDRLPLHCCLEHGLQPRLVMYVLDAYRCAAAVPKKDGKLPLHLAVENNFEMKVILKILEAHPVALIEKMPTPGGTLLVLEYALRNHRAQPVIECLLNGGSGDNPKAAAYARAAATGHITKDAVRDENTSGGHVETDVTIDREMMAQQRRCVRFYVKPLAGDPLVFEMDPDEKVDFLKLKVRDVEGTPVDQQRLSLDGRQLMDGYDLAHYGVQKDCQIQLQQRFALLQQALEHRADESITLKLLALRPETAREDDAYGVLPLHLALQNHSGEQVIKELLKHNPKAVKVEVSGGKLGEYPLHIALQRNYSKEVIKVLLKGVKEADWSSGGAYSPSGHHHESQCALPLHTAILNGSNKDTIKLLMDSRCPINARDPTTGLSALDCVLVYSAQSEELFNKILHLMLKAKPGAVTEAGPNGQLPLHVAVLHNASSPIVDKLCELGPSALSSYDLDGRLPIHLAVSKQAAFQVVHSLILRKSSVHARDGQGRTPLQLAVTHSAKAGVVFDLARADRTVLNTRDARGRSLIEMAVLAEAPPNIICELLEASPSEVENVNLLSGKWPNTKASCEAMRMATQLRERQRVAASGGHQRPAQRESFDPFARVRQQSVPNLADDLNGFAGSDGSGRSPMASRSAQMSDRDGYGNRSQRSDNSRAAKEEEETVFDSVAKWFSSWG
eukprot:gnl/TRDRNA2_/TRDRNA2_80844_c0_seq1.p1 gnl/TRDRNA2_/TRDRNA2_80844_c0~~gnl/TRDRNA2_/TRDRNA2_80844_c0_seq1.p1  ORF type:complete len:835 (+),score=180.54 gnl/TRDRNA2_/TRDRNA2_80844_c0_seq1:70-2574(+)